MKTFKVKNYKGNIAESLSRFQEKYSNLRVVEAIAENDTLKIKCCEDAKSSFDLSSVKNSALKKYLEVAVNNGFNVEVSYDFDLMYANIGYKITKEGLKNSREIYDKLKKACDDSNVPVPNTDKFDQAGEDGVLAFQLFPSYLIWMAYSEEDYKMWKKNPIEFYKNHPFHLPTSSYGK